MTIEPDRVPSVGTRLCRSVATLAPLAAAAFVVFVSYRWLAPSGDDGSIRDSLPHSVGRMTVTPLVRGLDWGVNLMHVSVLAWGLWTARTLLLRIAAGEVFETATGALLRRFGMALLVYAVLIPPVNSVTLLLVTVLNPPGDRALGFGIGSEEITLALVSIVILVTCSAMAEAARMAADHRQIV